MITIEEVRKMMKFDYEEVLKHHENTIDTKIENTAKAGLYSISYNSCSESINAELANRYRRAGFTVNEYISPYCVIEIKW